MDLRWTSALYTFIPQANAQVPSTQMSLICFYHFTLGICSPDDER